METDEIITFIIKMSNDKLDFKIRNYAEGNWINTLNGKWIIQRIYISMKKDHSINTKILNDIISKVNSESLKVNKEIILMNYTAKD